MKLKKWVKVLLTILILIVGIIIYLNLNKWGLKARSSDFWLAMSVIGWGWLFIGQFGLLETIWR